MKLLHVLVLAGIFAQGGQGLQQSLDEALQDEYKALSTYEAVIAKFGQVRPFSQIVKAERTHANSLLRLYPRYSLTPPVDKSARKQGETTVQFIKRMEVPGTVREAAARAYKWELENIEMYDRLLKTDLPKDVRQVFNSLRSASKDRHLPAFARAAGR